MSKIFSENLKKFREDIGLSQHELSTLLEVNDCVVFRWENNQAEPKADNLARLADIFKCSTDELVGRKFEDSYQTREEFLGLPFHKNVRKLRADRGFYTLSALAKHAGTSCWTVSRWETKSHYPQLPLLIKLADALRCPLDELLGRKPKKFNRTYYS